MFEHGMHDEDDDLMLDEEHNEHDVHDEDDNLLLEEHDDEPNLLLHGVRHQLLLGALRADDVLPVRDEALAHLRVRAKHAETNIISDFKEILKLLGNPGLMLTMLDLQEEQMKQSLCQCRPSKEMNLVPPIPEGVRGAERLMLRGSC